MAAITTDSAPSTTVPPLSMSLRAKLSIMMFLQFAVWGSWFTILGNYLKHLGFTDPQVGAMYALMPLGAIFATLFAGQIADRLLASEKVMAICHLAGAGLLFWMAQVKSPEQYWLLWGISLAYALLYNPTLALSNTIAFTHVPSGERDFPSVRVFGTIGWIVAGLLVGNVLSTEAVPAFQTSKPFYLAAGFSAVLGVISLVMPHTPPQGKAGEGIPFLKALALFKDPSFAVFFLVSFLITIVLAFYYSFTGTFLELGAGVTDVAGTMTIGQFAELALLPFLPWFLKTMKMRWVLALGMFCWGLRYLLFAFGGPGPELMANATLAQKVSYAFAVIPSPFMLVLIGVALHGICFDFFFAAGFIHVDNTAPKEIRGSGQALFSFLTYGVGMWMGSILSGYVAEFSKVPGPDGTMVINWTTFWLIPASGVILALIAFLIFFRPKAKAEVAGVIPMTEV